jgi:hypothetical protein
MQRRDERKTELFGGFFVGLFGAKRKNGIRRATTVIWLVPRSSEENEYGGLPMTSWRRALKISLEVPMNARSFAFEGGGDSIVYVELEGRGIG